MELVYPMPLTSICTKAEPEVGGVADKVKLGKFAQVPLVSIWSVAKLTDAICHSSPVAPVAPVTPVVPLAPGVPAPVAPAVPVTPVAPVGPAAPVAPLEPFVPLVPVEPAGPV